MNPPKADHGYGRPSLRAVGSTSRTPCVLGCRPLRRTIQVGLGFDLGFGISDLGFLSTINDIELNSSDFTICFLVLTYSSANFKSAIRIPQSSTRRPAHLRGLVTVIHEISGLRELGGDSRE